MPAREYFKDGREIQRLAVPNEARIAYFSVEISFDAVRNTATTEV
jgi:hypothetical protein